MPAEFAPGDVVRLRIGGPDMTIEQLGKFNWNDQDQALCKWFEGTNLVEKTFELTSLEKVR